MIPKTCLNVLAVASAAECTESKEGRVISRWYEIIIFVTLFIGLYWLGLVLLKVPTRKADQVFRISIVQRKSVKARLFDTLIQPLVQPVSQLIPVPYAHQIELQAELRQVGITLSAREYYARALILAICFVAVPVLVMLVGLHPVALVCTSIMPPVMFRHYSTEHIEKLKEKRHKIRLLLPSFVRSILYSISESGEAVAGEGRFGQVNLVSTFSSYLRIAPEVIRYDISLLITEMQSISVEVGLRRFGDRLRMPEVTYLCDILIGLSRGQPQAESLSVLARDIDIKYREARHEEMLKRPDEMKRALIPLAIAAMAILIVVLGIDLVSSIGYLW